MIKKILKIKNIGRYHIDTANDACSFGKQTIIFGPNKIGKTTLVAILKSLKENDTNLVISRKTFGSSSEDNQECEILYSDGTTSNFPSNWTNGDIEIFDNEFIYKNIFIGDKIEQNHKTQLHKILIDEKNLKTQAQIEESETKYKQIEQSKELIKKEIGINFDYFIKLKNENKIDDIDIKIKDNQNKQKQFYNQTKLNQLKSSTKLSFDFKKFEDNLKQSIDTKLEQKIKEHIGNCWNNEDKSVEFLKLGIDKLSERKNVCPFCGQSLENVSDLILNIKNFFSETYKQTQQAINNSIDDFNKIDIEKEIAQFKAEGFEFTTVFDDKILNTNLKNILLKINEKQKDLSIDVKIEELPDYINYKNIILAMQSEIQALKIETINIILLQNEEKQLKLNKDRFSSQGIDKFDRYNSIERELKGKKAEIDKLNNDLKNNLNSLFAEYLKDINTTLNASYANFRLADLKSISNRTLKDSFFCNYAFIFDNKHNVDISNNEDCPQFKNTLSDSDKRIFAFAFFIAKLKKDNSLENKTIVLDDPFTSLDEDRRDSMIVILGNLNAKQVTILSHSRSFVKRYFFKLNKNSEGDGADIKVLRLKNNSSSKTEIVKLDIGTDNDFLEGIEQYLKILSDADVSTIMSDYDNIRKIIEYIVKAKYGHLLDDGLGEKRLPMKYFSNQNCKSLVKNQINENDYQENHHDASDLLTPEELINKRNNFISNVLPCI